MELNRLGIVVGQAGYGKSTVVRREVHAMLSSHQKAVAFVHDPHLEIAPGLLKPYESAAAARAALELNARDLPRGFAIRGSSSSVRDLAVEFGKRHNTKDNVTRPIIQACDESSLMDSSSKTYVPPEDIDFMSNRRHYGIYLLLNVQTVTALSRPWYEQATDVWMFSQVDEDNIRELEKRLGLPKSRLLRSPLMNAPKFRFLHWSREHGIRQGGAAVAPRRGERPDHGG